MDKQLIFFHYSRRKTGILLLCYLLLLGAAVACGVAFYPQYYVLMTLAVFLCISATAAAAFVFFFPQNLAVISDRMIKIDHGFPLQWKDMLQAEELCTNRLCGRKIIVFRMKEGFKCPLTFMQRLCKNSCFTPFSIPLYAMEQNEQEKIRKEIAARIKLINQSSAPAADTSGNIPE